MKVEGTAQRWLTSEGLCLTLHSFLLWLARQFEAASERVYESVKLLLEHPFYYGGFTIEIKASAKRKM